MQSILGQPITASLVDQPPGLVGLGARIEVPVTREIVSAWQPAALAGSVWTVELESPVAPGDYQLVWRTSDPEPPSFEAFIPLTVAAGAAAAGVVATREQLTPEPPEVAALLIVRTGRAIDDDSTDLVGQFTEDTTPSLSQVEALIEIAVTDVISRVAVPIPLEQAAQARNLAAYWASVLAELGAVPEGAADEDRSVAPQLTNAYVQRLEDLKAACRSGAVRIA